MLYVDIYIFLIISSQDIMSLRCKVLLGVKVNERALGDETRNLILNRKQGIELYSCTKDWEGVLNE